MITLIHRVWIVAAALLLAACSDAPPPMKFPQLTYSHLGKIVLDVSKIEIVDHFRPTLRPPHIEHLVPVSPAKAAQQWARDRLKLTGLSGRRAVFTIDNGAVTATPLKPQSGLRGAFTVDQSKRYDAVIRVRLEVFEANGRRGGVAKANVQRSRSVPENITLDARDEVWFSITEKLTKDLNMELERSIGQFLGAYVR